MNVCVVCVCGGVGITFSHLDFHQLQSQFQCLACRKLVYDSVLFLRYWETG